MDTDEQGKIKTALTGICRSGGSDDTLIREFIRAFRCLPTHVRIADSAAYHSSQLVSLVKSALICVNLRFYSWRSWRFKSYSDYSCLNLFVAKHLLTL
jgi:hypothetical protein